MEKYLTLLSKFPILRDLSRSQLSKVGEATKERRYEAGQTILKEGEMGETMFLLLDGEVEVSKTLTLMIDRSNVDKRDKSLTRLSADDYACFGEIALVSDYHRRTATVRTLSKCVLGEIGREEFIKLCEADTQMGYLLMRNIASAVSCSLDKANKDLLKLTTAFSLALQE
jgi:CRP-like cAMP-binding protein